VNRYCVVPSVPAASRAGLDQDCYQQDQTRRDQFRLERGQISGERSSKKPARSASTLSTAAVFTWFSTVPPALHDAGVRRATPRACPHECCAQDAAPAAKTPVAAVPHHHVFERQPDLESGVELAISWPCAEATAWLCKGWVVADASGEFSHRLPESGLFPWIAARVCLSNPRFGYSLERGVRP